MPWLAASVSLHLLCHICYKLLRDVLLKWPLGVHKLIQYYPQSPEIGLDAVTMALGANFWCEVLLRAAGQGADHVVCLAAVSHPEVRQMRKPLMVEHDVLRL